MSRLIAATLAVLLVSGCADTISPSTYSVGQVGTVNRAVDGVIVSVRQVQIDRSSGVGGVAGAGIGAAGGSAIGSSTEANIAGAIAGAVVGGIIGAAAEKGASKTTGFEYVVRTSNGALLTLVQGGPPLAVNDPVIVMYGATSRVILDQSRAAAAAK